MAPKCAPMAPNAFLFFLATGDLDPILPTGKVYHGIRFLPSNCVVPHARETRSRAGLDPAPRDWAAKGFEALRPGAPAPTLLGSRRGQSRRPTPHAMEFYSLFLVYYVDKSIRISLARCKITVVKFFISIISAPIASTPCFWEGSMPANPRTLFWLNTTDADEPFGVRRPGR
jgi:hypothetical protein